MIRRLRSSVRPTAAVARQRQQLFEQAEDRIEVVPLRIDVVVRLDAVPGAVFCWLMPLTKRRHEAVLAAIEARKAGEPWESADVRAVL